MSFKWLKTVLLMTTLYTSGFAHFYAPWAPEAAEAFSQHHASEAAATTPTYYYLIALNFNEGDVLQLNNGDFWKIDPLFNTVYKWAEGETIRLSTSGELNFPAKLINDTRNEFCHAVVFGEPTIQQHCIKRISHSGDFLLLDDNSFYEVRLSDRSSVFWGWFNEDKVDLVYSGDKSYPYKLVNATRSSSAFVRLIRQPCAGTLNCRKVLKSGERIATSNGFMWEIRSDGRSDTYWYWYAGDTLEIGFSDDRNYPYVILNSARDKVAHAKVIGFSEATNCVIKELVLEGYYVKLADGSLWAINPPEQRRIRFWWKAGDPIDLVYTGENATYPYQLLNTNNAIWGNARLVAIQTLPAKSIVQVINNGEYVRLSDGSLWEIHPDARSTAWWWYNGDTLEIIESSSKKYPHCLINSKRVSWVLATLRIEGK